MLTRQSLPEAVSELVQPWDVVEAAETLLRMKLANGDSQPEDPALNATAMKRALCLQSKSLRARCMEPATTSSPRVPRKVHVPGQRWVGVATDNSVSLTINGPGRSRCSTGLGKSLRAYLIDAKGLDTDALLASADRTGKIRKKVRSCSPHLGLLASLCSVTLRRNLAWAAPVSLA